MTEPLTQTLVSDGAKKAGLEQEPHHSNGIARGQSETQLCRGKSNHLLDIATQRALIVQFLASTSLEV